MYQTIGFIFFLIFPFLFRDFAIGATLIDRIAAVVNQEVITESELLLAKTGPPAGGSEGAISRTPFQKSLPARSEKRLLKQAIETKLIFQTAQREGVRLTDSEFELALKNIETRNQFQSRDLFRQAVEAGSLTWDIYLADLRVELTLTKLISNEIDRDLFVTDEEVLAYYERFPVKFQADQIELKQIFFRVPPPASNALIEEARTKAQQVDLEIRKGTPFDEMIERHSEGLEREQGGSLGVFKRGRLMPDLEQVLFKLGVGEVSPVMQTPAGFHLFKVTAKITGPLLPFAEVRPEISAFLLRDKRETQARLWFNQVLKQTFIEIK